MRDYPPWFDVDGPEDAPAVYAWFGPSVHDVQCDEAWRASGTCPHGVKGYADDEATF
jgi:hypothetical protein